MLPWSSQLEKNIRRRENQPIFWIDVFVHQMLFEASKAFCDLGHSSIQEIANIIAHALLAVRDIDV